MVARLENQLIIQRQQRLLEQENLKRREAEEVLYQSMALLASVLNSSLDGIAAMQAVREPKTGEIEDFRCLVVNPMIARYFNSSREEMIGRLVLKKFLNRLEPELFNRFVNMAIYSGWQLDEVQAIWKDRVSLVGDYDNPLD